LHQQPQAWNRLKKAMRDRFVPVLYKRDLHKKLQHLEQGDMSVKEYFAELYKSMIRCGIEEDQRIKYVIFMVV
jgi:reverse gyrase